jgi:S-adenosylmethionine:tRNA ribosyltransferase-isomerase
MTDIKLFDYELPENLIAQYPLENRDSSLLLAIDRVSGRIEDRQFSDLPEYIRKGDVLVFNDSRVIKARLFGQRIRKEANSSVNNSSKIEIFLVKKSTYENQSEKDDCALRWEVLARPARRLLEGDEIVFGEGLKAIVNEKKEDGSVILDFECESSFEDALEKLGHVPLPPYIKREDEIEDVGRYQNVYAEVPGSVAAPTAGLHFTETLLERVRNAGAETVFVTLHVGLGTFRPVKTDTIEEHRMHSEYYHISDESAERINLAKKEGRRVICIGTTALRTLESAGEQKGDGTWYIPEQKRYGETDIYIYPGIRHSFLTDGLVTNFHLPKSTLIMLVSAFYDREKVLDLYQHAIEKEYRFFSYGDGMLIL